MFNLFNANQLTEPDEATATFDGNRQHGQLFSEQSLITTIAKRVVLKSPLEPWLADPVRLKLLLVLIDNLDELVSNHKTAAGFVNVQAIDLAFYSTLFNQQINLDQLLEAQQLLMLKSRVLGFAAPDHQAFMHVLLNGPLQSFHFKYEKIQAIRAMVKHHRIASDKRLPSGPLEFLK